MMTFDNLIALHEMLWPDTNLEQQLAKWQEEYKEYMVAKPESEECLYEIADLIIVSAGVARFDYCRGLDLLTDSMLCFDESEWKTEVVWQAVETKMRKNMKRDWVKKDDVGYKHTEVGEVKWLI